MSSSDNAIPSRASSVQDLPQGSSAPENPSAPSALTPYGDRSFDPKNTPFYAVCPQCKQKGLFSPETLHRWCSDGGVGGSFFSEPAKHLVRIETLHPYGRDDDLPKATQVIFASSCPNPACQSPLFLKVAGPKEEFAKIIRKRLGRPKGQSEEDLRTAELRLLDTLPKATEPQEWEWICNPELGPLCLALNRLAPGYISKNKRDPYDVVAASKDVLEALLFKLEAKKELLAEVAHLERKARWGVFGFILDVVNTNGNLKIRQLVRKEFRSASRGGDKPIDFQDFLDRAINNVEFGNDGLRAKIESLLKSTASQLRPIERANIAARLHKLYQFSLVDRNVWRWAVRLQREANASGEFFDVKRSKELAAFVRIVADDGFEQPFEISETSHRREESSEKNGSRIPTKG